MLGQSKSAHQAEIDSACELIDFLRFNVHFAHRILADQPTSDRGRLEPQRLPPARGVRPRDHAVQLHRDRRQPADRAGAARQRRRLEAVADPAARRRRDDAGARGGRPAAGRDQPGHRRRRRRQRGRDRPPRAGRHPLHRLDADVPAPVARGRQFDRRLRELPAAGRRDRRQGLRARAPVGRSGDAGHRTGSRRVRVSGPEVLGGLAGLHPAVAVGRRRSRRARRGDRVAALRRRQRLRELRRRGDRPARVHPAQRRARPAARGAERRRCWPAARPTTARDTSSRRPWSTSTDPAHEAFVTEYFGPILAVHVYDDARLGRDHRPSSSRWRRTR